MRGVLAMTVLENTKPVARKQHGCDICFGRIGVGDQYRRQRGIGDDGPYTHKAHRLCNAAYWQAMRDLDYDANWDEVAEWSEVRPYIERFFDAIAQSVLCPASRRGQDTAKSVGIGPGSAV